MDFKIYNQSAEKMQEIEDESIDLVITSPPYNIGTTYATFEDDKEFNAYVNLLKKIFSNCFRVQKTGGVLIIEVADSIKINKKYIQLAGLIQSICIQTGYTLQGRDINFIRTKNFVELTEHSFDNNYFTEKNGHSNCHQILTFIKGNAQPFQGGSINYINYEDSNEHPCPFNKNHFLLLDRHFKKGNSVLDPFMGTATLGVEVLKRGGKFYGYEIAKDFFETAKKKLEKVPNQ